MITNDTYLQFAMNHYANPTGKSIETFTEDLNRIIYIKKLLNRLQSGEGVPLRLILNHFIILFNTFRPVAAVAMLLFKLEKDKWCTIKTILAFMKFVPEEVPELEITTDQIPINKVLLQELEEL